MKQSALLISRMILNRFLQMLCKSNQNLVNERMFLVFSFRNKTKLTERELRCMPIYFSASASLAL